MGKPSRNEIETKGNTGSTSQDSHNFKPRKKINIFEKAARCFLKYLEILGQLEPDLLRFTHFSKTVKTIVNF
jgi:hypothetical protein